MKFTRRDFLKGGAITAIALALGLKPDKIIYSPVVDLPVKYPFADFEYYFCDEEMGWWWAKLDDTGS